MAVRVGQARNASRLLKMVGGKPHATAEDHEEVEDKKVSDENGLKQPRSKSPKPLEDVDTEDEPRSSDDDALRPPPRSSKRSPASNSRNEDGLKKPPGSTRKRKADRPLPEREPESELRKPGPKKSRNAAFRAPRAGVFEQNRVVKAALEGDKENKSGTQTPPASSDDPWGFGINSSQTSQKGPKKTFGSGNKARNIHTVPSATRKADRKPVKSASKSNIKREPSPDVQKEDWEDDDQFETLSATERNDALLGSSDFDEENPKLADPELRRVPTKKRKPATANGDGTALRDQLGLTDIPGSSLPPSSAPQEDMDNIDSYVRELPAETEEGTACPICNETVEQDYYWDFWKGRKNTVKNQAAFCHAHKKAAAQREYLAEGYPVKDGVPFINWAKLPSRIKQHRMVLHKILVGDSDTSSVYRTRYEPLSLTGKAAAVPSKRQDLSPSKRAELESYALDDNAVYPGYYGPHGRRLITESVMDLLSTEIKRCTDPVVQSSGPATFVQAVLVPEVAVRLIMEDLKIDWEDAEEVRERTFEIGALLNEEVEDRVEVADEDEYGNEYHQDEAP